MNALSFLCPFALLTFLYEMRKDQNLLTVFPNPLAADG